MPWMIPRLIKNLLAGPATRRYPLEKRTPFADARGALVHDKDKCDLCGDFVRLCPAAAIVMNETAKSLTYNPYRCIYCRLCAESCQHGALTATTTHQPPGQQVETLSWKR